MRLRIVETDCTDPYVNLAAEEMMTFAAAEDEMTLYLWQNAHTVVIGRNQNPWTECKVDRIEQDGVYLARRISGGGAVYHDLGNLNFTFIARDGLYDITRQTEVILHACRLLGIRAVKTGRNDLTVDGRKFSGHAYFSSGGFNYHHGTLMMDVVPDDLTEYLSVSDDKLKSKGVASVRSRVTNLRDYMPAMSREELIREMKAALIRAAEKEYGCEAVRETLHPDNIQPDLIEKYSSEEWRLGTRIPFAKEIRHRFGWGGVEIQLSMKGGYIDSCRVYSDSLETEVFPVIGKLLEGVRYSAADIRGLRIPEGLSATAYEILQLIAASV